MADPGISGLALKVLEVTGLPSGPATSEAASDDVYCVLSIGSCRFTTRSLPARRGRRTPAEAFLLSPRDLQHASQQAAHAAAATSSGAARAAAPDAAAAGGGSPVLSVELWSSKRWGSDAVTASGELLLGPFLRTLEPSGPPAQAKVMLHKAGGKASAKGGKAGGGSAGGGGGGSPGLESGWVLGAESQYMLLELAALQTPPPPAQLLGPVGSGRAEVPPVLSCSAGWLGPQRCVLHTSGGHLYQVPTVQLVKVTLHGARGLLNLHVDPQAAAAAAAAISRLEQGGEGQSKSERARLAAASVLAAAEGTRAGKALLARSSSWFGRKPSVTRLASVGSAVMAVSTLAKGAGAALPGDGGGGAPPSPLRPVGSPVGSSAGGRATPPPALTAEQPPAAGAAAAAEDAAAAVEPPGNANGDAGAAAATAVADGADGAAAESASRSSGSASSAAAAAAAASDGGGGEADARPGPGPSLALGGGSGGSGGSGGGCDATADGAADGGAEGGGSPSPPSPAAASAPTGGLLAPLEDPVTRLQQVRSARQTARIPGRGQSVDAEAVMAALEENGFHATDAPGGAFVYARLAIGEDSHTSRVVGLGPGGEAVWEQAFWLAAPRPAPHGSALEVELFASKDDKSRGKPVAAVKVPLWQLLLQQQQQQEPWFRSSHVLQASFSDHLHCSLLLTVEAGDWDGRAGAAAVPRALRPDNEAAGGGASGRAAAVADAPAAAATAPPGSGRSSLEIALPRPEAAAAAPGGVAGAAGSDGAPGTPTGSSGRGARDADALVAPGPAAARPQVAALDVVVKSFETRRPLDVFFVLMLGPTCLVSSTSHSTHHHSWGWHLQLPVHDPSELLTLALFCREDQAGGKRKVGASVLGVFTSGIRLVGKLRVRLSTICANAPLNISLPLQGERTNLRAGPPAAAVAHLYLHLQVPRLLGAYLASYLRFSECTPELYLLAAASGLSGDSSLEALSAEAAQTGARWLEQQPPALPARVFRRVQDGGRCEFTLSRTRANWRRLTLLRESAAPAAAAFRHLCSWESTAHSCACYAAIVLFGLYPSKVLAVALLALAVLLVRAAVRPPRPAAGGAAAVPAAAAAGGGGPAGRLLPTRPPPAMAEPGLAATDEALPGTAVPTDPYTSLRQNYDGVVQFLTAVQNVLDGWAAAGERLQLAFGWRDQLATAVLLALMVLLAAGLWVLGLQLLVTAGLLWVFRHPVLRSPLPPPPVNFVARMPTRSDTML